MHPCIGAIRTHALPARRIMSGVHIQQHDPDNLVVGRPKLVQCASELRVLANVAYMFA